MVDKITKALKTLLPKEKTRIKKLLIEIHQGDIRIIFQKTNTSIYILAIERRTDTTYNDY